MSFKMVGETQVYISNCRISCSLDSWHCWSQIEIERIFSLAQILTNLRRCRLELDNLNKIFFVSKNWPSDPRVGCSSPSSLIELIEVDLVLEEELIEVDLALEEKSIEVDLALEEELEQYESEFE